jgi:hypothetical protein
MEVAVIEKLFGPRLPIIVLQRARVYGIRTPVVIFDIIAGLASIAGLYFSIRAFREAKSASQAARQARDAILSRTVAEEIELACMKGDQLLDLLEHERFLEANIRAHDLTSALSEIPHRRSSLLEAAWSDELLTQRTQFQIIEQVTSGAKSMAPRDKARLIRVCSSSLMTLREILGKIKHKLDVGGRQ